MYRNRQPNPRVHRLTKDQIEESIRELVREGLVVDSLIRRNGQVVWVLRKYATPEAIAKADAERVKGANLEPPKSTTT